MFHAFSNWWREDSDALDKKLAKAVLDGNAGQVDSLLKRGAYVNAVISVDDFPTSEYINVREADTLNSTSIGALGAPWGRVVQHAYIKRDIPVMMALIHAGAELRFAYFDEDDSQRYMRSIVLHAATQNDREMLDWLIRGGVDLNAHKSFEYGMTALHAVCEGSEYSYFDRTRPDVIFFLVRQRFCDVNVQSGNPGWKMTNAHACVFDKGTAAPLNLERLMDNFLDINVFEGSEEAHFSVLRAAMVKASDVAQPAALRARRRTIVELILEYNVDFDFHDLGDITDGDDDPDISLLVEAKRHEQSVVYLRGLAPQHIDDVDRWGKTALHRAAENGQFDQVRILLLNGARFDTRDNMGRKPHDSARHRHNRYAETIKYNAVLSNDPGTPYRFHRSAALTLQKMAAFKRIYKYMVEVQNMKRVHAQYEAFHQQPVETRTEAPDEVARMYYRLLPQHLREVQSMLLGDEAS